MQTKPRRVTTTRDPGANTLSGVGFFDSAGDSKIKMQRNERCRLGLDRAAP